MSKGNVPLYFNRGEVSRLALGRADVDHMRLATETQINWQPTVLGPMTIRPGMQYLGATRGNENAIFIPFVFSNNDVAAIELTGGTMRVWVRSTSADTANAYAGNVDGKGAIVAAAQEGALEVITRPTVGITIQNQALVFDGNGPNDELSTNWNDRKPRTRSSRDSAN